jgi:hypothetical protein
VSTGIFWVITLYELVNSLYFRHHYLNFQTSPKRLNFMEETVALYQGKAGYAPNIMTQQEK